MAHGLGVSVNGQDPRSNVYLLDGTLLNDMTNGPAGSAAASNAPARTDPGRVRPRNSIAGEAGPRPGAGA